MAVAGLTSLLIGAAKPPKPPALQPPARMPDPQSPEVMEAARRRVAERRARSGRESTILTDDDAYSNDLLGE
jgi:hypothetical protein